MNFKTTINVNFNFLKISAKKQELEHVANQELQTESSNLIQGSRKHEIYCLMWLPQAVHELHVEIDTQKGKRKQNKCYLEDKELK